MARYSYGLSVKKNNINLDRLSDTSSKKNNIKSIISFTGSFNNEYELLLYLEKRGYITKKEFGRIRYVMKDGPGYTTLEEGIIYKDSFVFFDEDNIRQLFFDNHDNQEFLYYMLDAYVGRECKAAKIIKSAADKREDTKEEEHYQERLEEFKIEEEKTSDEQKKYAKRKKTDAISLQSSFKSTYEKELSPEAIERKEKQYELLKKLTGIKKVPAFTQLPDSEQIKIINEIKMLEILLDYSSERDNVISRTQHLREQTISSLVDNLIKDFNGHIPGKINYRKMLTTVNDINSYLEDHNLKISKQKAVPSMFGDLDDIISTETMIEDENFKKFFNKLKQDDVEVIKDYISKFIYIVIDLIEEQTKYDVESDYIEELNDFLKALSGVNVFNNTLPSLSMLLNEYEYYFRIVFRRMDSSDIGNYINKAVILK